MPLAQRAAPAEIADLARELQVAVDPDLLQLALTHRSFAYENGGIGHNERLEFLGDSILGQSVTVMLYTENPTLDEGELAKRRASLVSSVALAEVARGIGLGCHIRLGKGEEQTGGRDKSSILADTSALVLRLIAPLLTDPARFGASMDPKTSLQELSARLGRGVPRYVVSESGPNHSKRFRAAVSLGADATIASGEGSSKKQAEMAAALEAWTSLTTHS